MCALWIDKYKPLSFSSLDFNPSLSHQLSKMVDSQDLPHLLFYGPSGSGKKTRIYALLKGFYGEKVSRVKIERKEIQVSKTKKVEITLQSSTYHIELSLAELSGGAGSGTADRVVVQTVIKEAASTTQIDSKVQKNFKVIILNEVDLLSLDAQQALRRTMEKYTTTTRLVLNCTNIGKVMEPIQSRCLLLRIPCPSEAELSKALYKIGIDEGFISIDAENKKVFDNTFSKIIKACNFNARKTILSFQSIYSANNNIPLNIDINNITTDWEQYINTIAKSILEIQTASKLLQVRNSFYELLQYCIPPSIILKTLTNVLLQSIDDDLKCELVKIAAYYEYMMQKGSKPIMHLEAFTAKFMYIYKNWSLQLIS